MRDAQAPWNVPLDFEALPNLDPDHHYLTRALGFNRETMVYFGVGFCGRGMMQGRIAIPIHDADGQLVAYCGRRPHASTEHDRYAAAFNKRFEVYNHHRAQETCGPRVEGLIVTADFTHVWRLYEHGWTNVVALLEPEVSIEQLLILDDVLQADRRATVLFDWDRPDFVQAVFALHSVFYVQICRPPRETPIVTLDRATLRRVLQGLEGQRC